MGPANSLLVHLRAACAPAHASLESRLVLDALATDHARYRRMLTRFHGLYAVAERRLDAAHRRDPRSFDPAGRRKTGWLRRDLVALGVSHDEMAGLPEPGFPARPLSAAASWGVAYVLEGATLGGCVITARLRDGGIPAGARNFFASYGDAVGERWREFCAGLNAFDDDCGDETRETVAMAIATFHAFECWLEEPLAA